MNKEKWDCHEHRNELRVSFMNTVYHPQKGQLCIIERKYDGVLSFPIEFKDKTKAYEWIQSGYIADLQENFCHLGIGFTTNCFKENEPYFK